MKFIFVCPGIEFLSIQYRDFSLGDNTDLVLIGGARKLFKFLNCKCRFLKNGFLAFASLKKPFRKMKFNKDNDKKCFILYSRTFEDFREPIARFLRKRYPGCIVCVYFGDLVSRHFCSVNEVKRSADFVFSFDEKEAAENDFIYLLEPFSLSVQRLEELNDGASPKKHDISFVGHAKNRYQRIIEVYDALTKKGLDSDIHVSGVDEKRKVRNSTIKYGPLGFVSLLRTVVDSKCILEIMQDEGVSPTTRFAESIVLKRYLLTDCVYFKNNRYPNVIYYENASDLRNMDFGFLLKDPIVMDEDVKMFSVDSMIKTIESCVLVK